MHHPDEYITVICISERSGYIEDLSGAGFFPAKAREDCQFREGFSGGIPACQSANASHALDVLEAVEASLFENTDATVEEKAPEIDAAMRLAAFERLDAAVRETLRRLTLDELVSEAERQRDQQEPMFYI
jgi:hypothetical protein